MYKIPTTLLQAVLNYLTNRPYAEVFQLINTLAALEKINPEPGVENPEGTDDRKGKKK